MGEADAPACVDLVPLGAFDPGFASRLASRLSQLVAPPCRLRPPLPLDAVPLVAGREQADADSLLARLEGTGPAGVVRVGVTALDIAVPIFTFVFGRARRGGDACLVSIARLDPAEYGMAPDATRTLERAVAEILHELGHVAGLDHCRESSCLMSFAASVQAIDVRGSTCCRVCAARVPRWLRPAGRLRDP